MFNLREIDPDKPVLIFGPTASGKSALALKIAQAQGGVIVNADALQVYQGWPVLTAQPSPEEQARVPHALYGHLPFDAPYSAGAWLRDVTPYLTGARPIIVGGTGLNFLALTEGLADIPATPPDVRDAGNAKPLPDLLDEIDAATRDSIDIYNRARVQRAWEVQQATGRSIRDWQADTPPPLLPRANAHAFAMIPDVAWLNERIARRFDLMLEGGALDEARAMAPDWDPAAPSSKAIGARELIAVVNGEMTREAATQAAVIASRQYAKRQRTWARARMGDWTQIPLPSTE